MDLSAWVARSQIHVGSRSGTGVILRSWSLASGGESERPRTVVSELSGLQRKRKVTGNVSSVSLSKQLMQAVASSGVVPQAGLMGH